MKSIPLDADWRYFPNEVMDAAYGVSELDESSWGVLPNLADYPHDLIAVSGTLNLRRTFDIEPIADVCLRFFIDLQHAPKGTELYVNGWHLGTHQNDEALHADVTDTVSLEDNLILIKLTHSGELSGLSLQSVPCDL